MPLVLSMKKPTTVVKAAAGYGVPPAAHKDRLKQLSSLTPKVPKAAERAPDKPVSSEKVAADMGYAAGFCQAIKLPDAVFEKVAARVNLPVALLKAAYFVKMGGPNIPLGRKVQALIKTKAQPSPKTRTQPSTKTRTQPSAKPAPQPSAKPAPQPSAKPEKRLTAPQTMVKDTLAPETSAVSAYRGLSPLAFLAGGALLPWLLSPVMRRLQYPQGMQQGYTGREYQFGGLDPRTESELAAVAARRMALNAQSASMARRFADATRIGYAPSPSPYALVPGGG
jgi:hypothetical protein